MLILDDGTAVFDTSVICAYLDRHHDGGRLIPEDVAGFVSALRLNALADGLSEAGILARWEAVRRPEPLRYQPLLEGQQDKLREGYDFIEQQVSLGDGVTIGEIALASALSWLEFRGLPSFRRYHPKLTAWYDRFCERPSMQATALSDETHG